MDTTLKDVLIDGVWIISDIAFIITLGLITILFVSCLLLSLIKKDYTLRKRVWYFSASCGIILLSIVLFKKNTVALISLSALLIYFGIIFSISPKKDKMDELDEFIDRQIEFPIKEEEKEPVRKMEQKLSVLPLSEKRNNPEIDYSHVKSVIERISLLSLNQSDRKTVKELELCVLGAENGDDRIETKRKINDGIGALLKIMSKYGA